MPSRLAANSLVNRSKCHLSLQCTFPGVPEGRLTEKGSVYRCWTQQSASPLRSPTLQAPPPRATSAASVRGLVGDRFDPMSPRGAAGRHALPATSLSNLVSVVSVNDLCVLPSGAWQRSPDGWPDLPPTGQGPRGAQRRNWPAGNFLFQGRCWTGIGVRPRVVSIISLGTSRVLVAMNVDSA